MTCPRKRPGGRSARVRAAVHDAVIETLLADGPDKLSVAAVAARAGVHETSVYRRWRTRENLVVDALLTRTDAAVPIPDTGSVRADLIALGRLVAAFLAEPVGKAVIRVGALAAGNPELAPLRADFWSARLERSAVIVHRAVERGELPPGTDARLLLHTLVAPLHSNALLTDEPSADDLPERLADLLLDGLRPR